MKKGLPKFVLLTDPSGLEGRILIFRTQYPRFVYELNRSEEEPALALNVGGKEYTIVVRQNLNDYEIKTSYLKEAIRWYHYKTNPTDEHPESTF